MESWFQSICRVLRERRLALSLAAAGGVAAVALLHGSDHALIGRLASGWNRQTESYAHFLYKWGDVNGAAVFAGALWLAGRLLHRAMWRQAAIGVLAASLLAGAIANIGRFTVGRPRPRYSLQEQYYPPSAKAWYSREGSLPRCEDRPTGPSLEKKFQSFPSAHTATSFGAATAAVILVPPAGCFYLAYAGLVGWSRMYKLEHYPSDVAAGGMIGILCGGITAAIVLRRRQIADGERN